MSNQHRAMPEQSEWASQKTSDLAIALQRAHWALAQAADRLWESEGCSAAYRNAVRARDDSGNAWILANHAAGVFAARAVGSAPRA